MMIQEYLASQNVPYRAIEHATTHTARHLARLVDAPPSAVAKTVLLAADGGYVLAVLPADRIVDLTEAARCLGARGARVASEVDCSAMFPESEIGAMPPFGSQHGLRTIVDRRLIYQDEIVFTSDTHRQAIRMQFADFERLEKPLIGDFARAYE
jgi:Ala-tRNA(Pro) deacylase